MPTKKYRVEFRGFEEDGVTPAYHASKYSKSPLSFRRSARRKANKAARRARRNNR